MTDVDKIFVTLLFFGGYALAVFLHTEVYNRLDAIEKKLDAERKEKL